MSSMPCVSIVMPTLNQRPYIAEAVASVFAQGEDVLELVVVDGGSSDGTLTELAALADRLGGRLRWTSGPDTGPAQAVNRAVARTRGAIIGWLNSDDLYVPGAVVRALAALQERPDSAMVYGEGEHIDAAGRRLGRYPTLAPPQPLAAFEHGCFICQPTAFFRRDVFDALGGLDETLRTAFDFEFWLRLIAAAPDRIAFVPAVQALSRLHEGSITLRQRERVALEGLRVLRRHVGPAPAEWMLTYFEERARLHPFEDRPVDLVAELAAAVDAAEGDLSSEGLALVRDRLQRDRCLQLASPHVHVAVHPDGWAPPELEVRLRQPARPLGELRLLGRHARPGGSALQATVLLQDGRTLELQVPDNGPFEWRMPVTDRRAEARIVFRIRCSTPFVPADSEPGSTDRRELAYLVDAIEGGEG